MPHRFAPRILIALLACALAALDVRIAAADAATAATADALYRRAVQRFAVASPDSRIAALKDFDEASRLAPGRRDIWVAYGRACLESGRFDLSRRCLGRAASLGGRESFDAWYELGGLWKRDWLASLDRDALEQAMKCYTHSTEATPGRAEGWCGRAACALLQGHPREALDAALNAYDGDKTSAEPMLMLGAALYRCSVLDLSDSLFRVARARLTPEERRHFDDEKVLGKSPAALASVHPESAEAATSVWEGTDPDLTTAENEAQLDYWTRSAIALFLFREGDKLIWDQRADLFVRYGPPTVVQYNPAWGTIGWENDPRFRNPRLTPVEGAPPPLGYPYNIQIWTYPHLGMDVTMWDRSLQQRYELQVSDQMEFEPRPNPGLLAGRADLIALGDGHGVFRALAPGAAPMPVVATLSRFPTAEGVLVLAHVFAKGEPADSLRGTWAIVDADGHTVQRVSRPLSVSACDPTEQQVADFSMLVPPGEYRIDLSVGGVHGRRGVAHLRTRIAPAEAALEMSDLVLLCNDQGTAVGPEGIRIEPNVSGIAPRRRTMSVYYELERLALAADGTSRFSYAYSIRPVLPPNEPGPPPAAVFEASREEENNGTHRRQFVSLPIAALRSGEYEARVEVRDLVSGAVAERTVRFIK